MARKTRQNRAHRGMFPTLVDGKIWVPVRAEGPDGIVGDAWVQSDDPDLRRALEAPVAPAQGMIAGQRETPSESLPGAFWSLLHSVSVPGETPDTEAH